MLHSFCVSEWYVCGRSLYQLAGSLSACCRSCMFIPFPTVVSGWQWAPTSYCSRPLFLGSRVYTVETVDTPTATPIGWPSSLTTACHTGVTCLSSADILGLFDPEDEGNTILHNIGTYLLNDMTQCHICVDLNLLPQIVWHVTTRVV
jgi:hypothetical protein